MAKTLSVAPKQPQSCAALLEKLSSVLPKDHQFGIYHLSTPPTKTDALCHPPPDQRPDRTYCENHFLAVTIKPESKPSSSEPHADRRPVIVLALEIFIFTTAYSSIFFVSKADSTGYLHLLNLPKGTPSPIREVSSAFLAYLIDKRRRKGIQTTVNLFARAQDQYLFPGSIKNGGKHVLDDRGLVKWWCRVLDPLLEEQQQKQGSPWQVVKGYLLIPGLDHYETRAFIPRTANSAANWVLGHPLEKISHYCQEYDWVPPRCLIPKYPDDPKSRYRDELDEEASNKEQNSGAWRSVKTLEQFWEMMSFRQECSSGRMTGFIWVVFDPKDREVNRGRVGGTPMPNGTPDQAPPGTPSRNRHALSSSTPKPSPKKTFGSPSKQADLGRAEQKMKSKDRKKKKKILKGPIVPRQPRIKTRQRNYLVDRPVSSAYYYWPAEGRGQKIVDESDYKRCTELLLRLDFATLDKAAGSTRRWIEEVGMGSQWGLDVQGKMEMPPAAQGSGTAAGVVNNLSGLVRKKPIEGSEGQGQNGAGVNMLGAGLVRKKRKESTDGAEPNTDGSSHPAPSTAEEPKVNMLGAGMVRKKPKLA